MDKVDPFCISTIKFSVLIIRSPVDFFSPQKGLRHEDPLSPYCLFLAVEGLIQLLEKAKELQWIQGFQVGRNPSTSVTVFHLLYAVDTLIFVEQTASKFIVMVFESIFGLHINMLRSKFYPVNEVKRAGRHP